MAACPYSVVMCICVVSYGCLFGMAVTFLFWPGFDPAREEAAFARACKGAGSGRHGRPTSALLPDALPASSPGIKRGLAAYLSRQIGAVVLRNESGGKAGDGPGGGSGLAGVRVLECSAVHSASDLEFVAGGWTKAVYRAKVWGQDVAIKTVNLNGLDVRECQRAGGSLSACYRRAAAKILRELVLLGQLRHENIIQVLGSCIPDAVGSVAMVTELGDPLDTVRLLQLSWEDRLRLALGMARILHRLAHSPLGSLGMNDFRRQQFVIVGRTTLKLSDVDDVGIMEPSCATSEDCLQRLPTEMLNESSGVLHSPSPCIEGRCVGYNEKLNVWHAGRHFIRLFLPLNVPSFLNPHIQELLEAYKSAKWNSEEILKVTERLVASTVSGDYSEVSTIDLKRHERTGVEVVSGDYDISKR